MALTGGPSNPERRGPRPLGDVLGDLFAARGYSRIQATGALEAAWATAVGEPAAGRTRVLGLRQGVLTVAVAHSALLEELAAFRKTELLAALRTALPAVRLLDLRFKVGPIDEPRPPTATSPPTPAPTPTPPAAPGGNRPPPRPRSPRGGGRS